MLTRPYTLKVLVKDQSTKPTFSGLLFECLNLNTHQTGVNLNTQIVYCKIAPSNVYTSTLGIICQANWGPSLDLSGTLRVILTDLT